MAITKNDRALREPAVLEKTGCGSHSSLWRWIRLGKFPKPIRIGPKSVAWRESELDAWLASREAAGSDNDPTTLGKKRNAPAP